MFFEEDLIPGWCLPLSQGYTLVHDHYFRTHFSQKPLFKSKLNLMWSLLGKGNHTIKRNTLSNAGRQNSVSHLTALNHVNQLYDKVLNM